MTFNPNINNTKWQVILIPVICFIVSVILSYDSGVGMQAYRFPVLLFITLCFFTFFIWKANLVTYRILDKKLAFYESPSKRLLYQIIFCSLTTWGCFFLLYTANYLIINRTLLGLFSSGFFFFFLIASIISLLINCFYIIRYLQYTVFYTRALSAEQLNDLLQNAGEEKKIGNNSEPKEVAPVNVENAAMLIETGAQMMTVVFADMAYWYSAEGMVVLVLTNGRKITTNFSSFVPVLEKLPTTLFFQLSRQFITHVESILLISDDENRKLIVDIVPKAASQKGEKVTVSRYRSMELKKWFMENMGK